MKHLLIIWLLVFAAAGFTIGLFSIIGMPAIFAVLAIGLAVRFSGAMR